MNISETKKEMPTWLTVLIGCVITSLIVGGVAYGVKKIEKYDAEQTQYVTGTIQSVTEKYEMDMLGLSKKTTYIEIDGNKIEIRSGLDNLDFLVRGQAVVLKTYEGLVTEISVSK